MEPRLNITSRSESGAALIVALVIVALMSITTLTVLDNLRFSIRLTSNIENREQTRLFALGAEELAAATLQSAWRSGEGPNRILDQWVAAPLVFPIDGGVIEGRVRDGGNCFNLNAVVEPDGNDGFMANTRNADVLVRLMAGLGVSISDAQTLTGTLIDWIDSDSTPTFGGAEDYYYVSLATPYRTSGQLLSDTTELKSMADFTPEMVAALAPHVCARPFTDLTRLNVNTLEVEDAVLLEAYLGGAGEPTRALRIIGEKPLTGYTDLEQFFIAASLTDSDDDAYANRALFSLVSALYDVSANVSRYESFIRVSSTLQISDTGEVKTISRRYGSSE